MDGMRMDHGYSSKGLCFNEEPNIDTTSFFLILKYFYEPL